MALFSHTTTEELSLLIDIQSGLVRGSLISFKKNTAPHIIFVATRAIPRKEKTSSEQLTNDMLVAVRDIVELLGIEGVERAQSLGFNKRDLKDIHYVLSSPWVMSESKTIHVVFDTETSVSEKLINTIVDKEKIHLKDDFKEGLEQNGGLQDLVCMEQKIFEIKLNGYRVEEYIGRKTHAIDISFASTLCSGSLLEKIHSCVQSVLHIKKHSFHSSLLLYFASLRLIVGNRDEFISIHVHSELTDIVVVKRSTCAYIASFPFGTNTLSRKVALINKSSITEADSVLSLLYGKKLEEHEEYRVGKIIDPVLTEWHEQCLACIEALGERTIIPNVVYLSSHDHFEVFKELLIHRNSYTFEILPFDETLMTDLVVFEKTAEHNPLVSAYALALKDMI